MSIGCLPESITKDVLFKKAQERFQSWAKMYGDPNISATYMYEDMSASCYCGAPQDDFPEIVGPKKEVPVKISDTEFRYRDVAFRITRDETDDKSYIWADKDSDDLVWWTWGGVSIDDKWLIEILDKFIDSHEKEEQNG